MVGLQWESDRWSVGQWSVDLMKPVYNNAVIFSNVLLFCLKGYSETLNLKVIIYSYYNTFIHVQS